MTCIFINTAVIASYLATSEVPSTEVRSSQRRQNYTFHSERINMPKYKFEWAYTLNANVQICNAFNMLRYKTLMPLTCYDTNLQCL
jgi:hypothetical protein